MSYKSPVEIWCDDFMNKITTQIQENNEMQIMAAVNQYVSVDKEELIKALQYDRQQYEKGYADAKAEYQRPQGEWIEENTETGALGIKYTWFKCSQCGWDSSLVIPNNFCPNCGAKMVSSEKTQEA